MPDKTVAPALSQRGLAVWMSNRMAISAVKDIKDGIEFNIEQKSAALYAQAEDEYNNGEIDKGLWSQALIKAKGDENLRKIEYMKLRAKQLKKDA